MGSSAKTITIFKQWQKLLQGNLGCSFQMCTYDLRRRKSHLKLRQQVHSSHIGNISTARHRAGSDTCSPAMPLALCHMFYVARASSRVHAEPRSVHTGHRSKGLGQHWPRALSLSKAWEHQAPKCVPAPMLLCKQPQFWANLNLRTGSDTCVTHRLDKS